MATPGSTSNAGNPELLKAITALTKAIDGISKSMHTDSWAAARRSRGAQPGNTNARKDPSAMSKREADAQYNRNKRLGQNQEKAIITLVSELHGFGKELNKLSGETKKSQKEYGLLLKKQNEHAKTILEHDKLSKKYQDRFVGSMEQVLKSSKTLSGNKLKSTTTGGRVKEVLGIQDRVKNVLTTHSRIKAKNGGGAMDEKDIGSLMKSMSAAGVTADGMDEKQYQDKLSKLNAKHDKEIAARRKAIRKHVGSDRPDDGRLQKLNEALKAAQEKAKSEKDSFLAESAGKVQKGVAGVEAFNKSMNNAALTNMGLSTASDFAHKAIEKLGGEGISLSSGFKMIGKALGQYYEYTKTLANKQMGGLHMQLQSSSASMGTSTDATIKYFTTMSHQISQFGFKAVTQAFNDNKGTIEKLGLFGDDALEYAGKAAATFENMGVTVKDSKKFNATMTAYATEMNEMSKLSGISVAEQMAANDALVKSAESTQMMMRISKEERAVKMMGIITERNRIVQMGATIEQAQEFVKTLQALNSESPEKRIENSMKVQQLAQMTGMGADGARLAGLLQKRPEQLTDDERSYMADTIKEIGSRSEQLKGGGMANEMLINRLQESLGSGNLSKALKEGAEVGLASDNKGVIDRNSDVAKGVSKDKQMNETVQALMSLEATVKNFLALPAIALLTGIAAGVAVIAMSAGAKDKIKDLASKGLSTVADKLAGGGGKLAADGVKDAVGGASKAVGSTVAKDVGSTVLKDVGGAAAGVAAKEAGEVAVKTGGKGLGKSILKKIPGVGLLAGLGFGASRLMDGDYLGAAGEVASGAASTIPGLGTAASVAIDAGLAARDIHKAMNPVSSVNGLPTESAAGKIVVPNQAGAMGQDTINNSSSVTSSKKDPVQDLIASVKSGDELEQSKMDEMIKLLKTLIETVKPENNGLLQAIRSGSATGVSFNDLHDKRTLLSTK